MNPA
jgi:hypothetical protein